MDQQATSTAQALVEYGKDAIKETTIGGIPTVIIPNNSSVHTFEDLIDERLEKPRTIKQNFSALSIDSFIQYYNRFASEHSTIFADTEEGKIIAVLDYHQGQTDADWKRHTIVYTCPLTKEWKKWMAHNNEKMEQIEFALFIEDHQRQITNPNGSVMLQIATSLKAKSEVEFKSNMRLDNGETQFTYHENIDGTAGNKGQLTIPEVIQLALRPFQNGSPYAIEARFRYRVQSGKLRLWYTLQQPDICYEDAVTDLIQKVKDGIQIGHLVHGTIRN